MKQIKRFFAHGLVALMGIALLVLGCLDMIDSFWSGMGAALVVVGVLRIIRTVRLHQDESYRQKVETEASDERNRFIRKTFQSIRCNSKTIFQEKFHISDFTSNRLTHQNHRKQFGCRFRRA